PLIVWTLVLGAGLLAQNQPPNPPTITEPVAPNMSLNPFDVHMETGPFTDPDPGDTHWTTDWEIWSVATSERVWHATGMTGFERIHIHLGDGVFTNSHVGWMRLFASTSYVMRVRHNDDSGDAATQASPWVSQPFVTGKDYKKQPLAIDDIEDMPSPLWLDDSRADIDLPVGSPNPTLRIENDAGMLLLVIEASAGPGNQITNPPILPEHRPVKVIIDAGDIGQRLVLPPSQLLVVEHACNDFKLLLPAVDLAPGQHLTLWVSSEGATYKGNHTPQIPEFLHPARGIEPPWVIREPGYLVEVAAEGLRLPLNIAFVPNPGNAPGDPKFYVGELYGAIKTVTNDGSVLTYASNLLNYTPTGTFPGSGEQGLTGVAVDGITGDVFVAHLWHDSNNEAHPRITRFSSADGGRTAASSQVILDMPGEPQGQSHLVSELEIVDGKLFCHMGDGFETLTSRDLSSYRGKILCLELDGSPVITNPFYDGGVRDPRDYIYVYGVRNPFGGAWRAADNSRYFVENGPSIDRLSKIVKGRDYKWNGSNDSIRNYASYIWDPARGPVNLAFIQPETFGGSGFPADKMDHAFVSESGPTFAYGQQRRGKSIRRFVLDNDANLLLGPIPFADYVGDGRGTVAGLTAGPDGLYFSELYRDRGSSGPTDAGARVFRISYGDPEDCNNNGTADWCEIGYGVVADCNDNRIPDSCELQSGTAADLDNNGVLDECDPLSASAVEVPSSVGGRIDFEMKAGAEHGGLVYQFLGSSAGTIPGMLFGSVNLPLNPDWYFDIIATAVNTSTFENTLGLLDANGRAQASLHVPPLLPMHVGMEFHHAYIVFDFSTMTFEFTSNAVPLVVLP
ncbi:MAG: PQQ-dependent sugar dehydrogenase, partial [Planctomycetota bacterium]|nr:PQQ-dependent sugar dehydrogenase [Planctomycetota bacterium]